MTCLRLRKSSLVAPSRSSRAFQTLALRQPTFPDSSSTYLGSPSPSRQIVFVRDPAQFGDVSEHLRTRKDERAPVTPS